jgi:uncharacterized protein (DUF427 family)
LNQPTDAIAESTRPIVVSETGRANRYYVPREATRTDILQRSDTRARCPYKGQTSYFNVRIGDGLLKDAALSHDAPVEGAVPAADHLCFLPDRVEIWVDGERG